MSEALIQAAVDLLDDSLAAVRAAIAGAPLEALAWQPPAEDANPLVSSPCMRCTARGGG